MKLENVGCVLCEASAGVNPKGGLRSQCATYIYVISLPVVQVSHMGHRQVDPARCQDLP